MGHTDWGADRIVLLRLYRSLVRSELDYACIVYGSARRSILKQLDPIHYQGLRIALGAFRTSPAQSLYIEAHEPSLTTRRLKCLLELYTEMTREGREIVFIWVPGHVGIKGNSAADSASKDALDGDISVELIPFSDLKPRTNK